MDTRQYDMDDTMSHEMALSHEIEKRDAEINELKAMVNALREPLCSMNDSFLEDAIDHIITIASLTPAQCLANVKADAIDSAIGDIGIAMANARLDSDDVLSYLINESKKLRKTMITTSSESSLSEVVNKINEEL